MNSFRKIVACESVVCPWELRPQLRTVGRYNSGQWLRIVPFVKPGVAYRSLFQNSIGVNTILDGLSLLLLFFFVLNHVNVKFLNVTQLFPAGVEISQIQS